MSNTTNRKRVLQALNGLLAVPQSGPVVRVLEGKRPPNEQPTYFKEVPRLVVALEGTGRYITIENSQEMIFDLVPGQVLYLAPCTWSCPLPQMAYRSLAVTLRPDLTRVTIHSRGAMRKNGTIPWRYLAEWQTASSLGKRGEHLLELLADPTPPRLGERMYNTIAEIILSEVVGLVESAPELEGTHDTILWHSVLDYISTHWSDPSLSRDKLAEFFNRHPNHISRFFHKHTRLNFRAYVNEIRLKRSLEFLGDLRYNVTDVASQCGYTDLQYFIRCFRQRFDLTPGEYRKRRLN
jgi:AraC-like DNA-binding protein